VSVKGSKAATPSRYIRFNGVFDEEETVLNEEELFYVMSGRGVYRIDRKDYTISRGTLILLRAGQRCALRSVGNMVIYRINYTERWRQDLFFHASAAYGELVTEDDIPFLYPDKGNILLHFESVDRERVEWLIHDMHREVYFKEANWEAVFSAMMCMLFLTVIRRIGRRNRGVIQMNQDFLEYVRARSNEKLTMKLLAQECCYNPSYFSRIFREKFGLTITDFINTCRVDNAKELLTETDLVGEDIAAQVGFSSKSAFYKKFLQETGMTPKQWRIVHTAQSPRNNME